MEAVNFSSCQKNKIFSFLKALNSKFKILEIVDFEVVFVDLRFVEVRMTLFILRDQLITSEIQLQF